MAYAFYERRVATWGELSAKASGEVNSNSSGGGNNYKHVTMLPVVYHTLAMC
jgi:hypothetical protein